MRAGHLHNGPGAVVCDEHNTISPAYPSVKPVIEDVNEVLVERRGLRRGPQVNIRALLLQIVQGLGRRSTCNFQAAPG